jgi:hypothetical protein
MLDGVCEEGWRHTSWGALWREKLAGGEGRGCSWAGVKRMSQAMKRVHRQGEHDA